MNARRTAELGRLLDVGDRESSDRAARELARVGPEPELIESIARVFCVEPPVEVDPAIQARFALWRELSRPFPAPPPERFLDAVASADAATRVIALRALSLHLDRREPSFWPQLRDSKLQWQLGQVVEAVAAWLGAPEPEVRAHAAETLGAAGPAADGAVHLIARLLVDADEDVRRAAALALRRIVPETAPDGAPEPPASPPFMGLSEERALRLGICVGEGIASEWVLGPLRRMVAGERGELEPETVGFLVDGAFSADPMVRAACLHALVRRREVRLKAVVVARRLLADPEVPVRRLAVRELTALGASAISTLLVAATDESPLVRAEVARALGHVKPGGPATAETLARMAAKTEDVAVRLAAISSLGEMGQAAERHLAPIGDTLYILSTNSQLATKEPDRPLRLAGLDAIAALGPTAESLGDLAANLLEYPDPPTRAAAARALGSLGVIGPRELNRLVAAAEDPKPGVRVAVVQAIGRLGVVAARGVPMLVARHKDPDWRVRDAALEAIKALGPAAAAARSILAAERDASALAALGPAGIPKLASLVQHPRACGDVELMLTVARLGPMARPLAPWIVLHLDCAACWLNADYALTFLDPSIDDLAPGAAWEAGCPDLGLLAPSVARFHSGAARLARTLSASLTTVERPGCAWLLGRLGAAAATELATLRARPEPSADMAIANIVARTGALDPVRRDLAPYLEAARTLGVPLSVARLRAWQLEQEPALSGTAR